MIIAVTDAKDLTKKVEALKDDPEKVINIYVNLFKDHISAISNSDITWKIIKTTGDGLLITATKEKEDESFLGEWCQVMYGLYIRSSDPAIRIVAHYCKKSEIATGLKLDFPTENGDCRIEHLDYFLSHVAHDIFGSAVNLLFRLSHMLSGKVFAITEQVMNNCIPEAVASANGQRYIGLTPFEFGPAVPITFLKGIDSIGFSDSKSGVKPIWLWEVKNSARVEKSS